MKFTAEKAEAILNQMSQIVESLDYPAAILIATPNDTLMSENEKSENQNQRNDIFCSASVALINLLKPPLK